MPKQTSDKISEIASKALKTGKATVQQIRALAASALGQDETKGGRPAKKSSARKPGKKATAARKAAAKSRRAAKAKK